MKCYEYINHNFVEFVAVFYITSDINPNRDSNVRFGFIEILEAITPSENSTLARLSR